MRFCKAVSALLVAGLLIVPASAHGGHCRQTSAPQAPACTVQGCTESGRHWHDGTAYCGTTQPLVYQPCTVEGCAISGRHFHDGNAYCGADHAGAACDGTCQTRALCTVEGCTLTGYHQHNGENYCGAVHAGGCCDGSCQAVPQSSPAAGSTQSGCHHHGGHH